MTKQHSLVKISMSIWITLHSINKNPSSLEYSDSGTNAPHIAPDIVLLLIDTLEQRVAILYTLVPPILFVHTFNDGLIWNILAHTLLTFKSTCISISSLLWCMISKEMKFVLKIFFRKFYRKPTPQVETS